MPLMMMQVTVNSRADTTTARGMTANKTVSLGRNVRTTKIAATANATTRLATPVAAANPTAGVEVLVPTAPARPATTVEMPSASTPRRVDSMSGRTQSASFMGGQTAIVPAAFMAAATEAIAKGSTSVTAKDEDRWPKEGMP